MTVCTFQPGLGHIFLGIMEEDEDEATETGLGTFISDILSEEEDDDDESE